MAEINVAGEWLDLEALEYDVLIGLVNDPKIVGEAYPKTSLNEIKAEIAKRTDNEFFISAMTPVVREHHTFTAGSVAKDLVLAKHSYKYLSDETLKTHLQSGITHWSIYDITMFRAVLDYRQSEETAAFRAPRKRMIEEPFKGRPGDIYAPQLSTPIPEYVPKVVELDSQLSLF